MITSNIYPAQGSYLPITSRFQASFDNNSQTQGNFLDTNTYISPQFSYQQQAPMTSTPDPMSIIQTLFSILNQMLQMVMNPQQVNQQTPDIGRQADSTNSTGKACKCSGQSANPINQNLDPTTPSPGETATTSASTDTSTNANPTASTDTSTNANPTANSESAVASDTMGAPKTAVTQPANSVNLKDLGVKGDGQTDDQAAIQAALDKATPGTVLWLPPGTYNHSGVLRIPGGVTLTGAGDSTVLKATDPNHAAVMLWGSKGAISNFKVISDSNQRIPNAEASAIWLKTADGATVSNITSVGSGANNVTIDRSNNCVVDHVLGVGSNADGIAINNGSVNNTVQNSIVRESGDDSFSDDSYLSDEVASSGNQFLNNLSVDNRYGDNYKLAGAANDTLDGNVSLGGPKGGVVVIQDKDSGTKASTGNTIKNSVAIDLPAPDVSAFMVEGQTAENNQYYTQDAAEAKKYIDLANQTAGDYAYNKEYQAGTGPGANNRGGVHLYQ